MTEHKHTPLNWYIDGQWLIADDGCDDSFPVTIAKLQDLEDDEPGSREANGNLLAAAPELLAELEALATSAEASLRPGSNVAITYVGLNMQIKSARAAIAKAIGTEE